MELTSPHWHKSTRSDNGGASCVEVADNLTGIVLVRDSKDPDGPVLAFHPAAWTTFLTHTRTTEKP